MKINKWKILVILGFILILIASFLLIRNIYVDNRAGKLSNEVVEKIHKELEEITTNKEDNNKKETLKIDGNEYLGIISIPTLDLELPVMNDWSYKKMRISPGKYYGELENNDLVICAHAYKSLFRYIKDLNPKDILILTDINGNEHIYEVKLIEILAPEDITEMIESEFDLTLFTCTNDNQNRVTVRLNRVEK